MQRQLEREHHRPPGRPDELTVTGTASHGNLSETVHPPLTGTAPATPYTDGDFNGGGQPDLLTLGTGSTPSLWLAPSNGNGTLGAATDIGSAGTGINPGADGPGDWAGAVVTHGDFTGNHVQDVMAYYPAGTQCRDSRHPGGQRETAPR